MKKSQYTIQLLVCFLFLTTMACAQTGERDTVFIKQAITSAREVHLTKTNKQSPLYNGSQYAVYDQVEEEHPYFLTNDWIDGSIVYSGERFENIPLMYDLSIGRVIAEHFAGAAVELIPEKVSSFNLNGHLFRKFAKEDDSRRSINEGFYEVLHDGKIKILKRWVKTRTEIIRASELVIEFEERTHYYVVKDKAFYSFRSTSALLKLLSDKKTELRRFRREKKLASKSDNSLIQLAAHYDTLIP